MYKQKLFSLVPIVLLAACSQESGTTPASAAPVAANASAQAAMPATVQAEGPGAGERTYKQTCAMCHASGVAGAPVPGAAADWEPRIAQGNDVLYQHALEGFTGEKGMMPAKGGNPSLSDDDVRATVDYMVSQSK